jgi:PPIC-type PPIASE domain
MSTSPNPSLTEPFVQTTQTSRLGAWPAWLREPLLHFVLLGALLFAIDHVLLGRSDDPSTIVVGAEVDKEARDLFKASRGQDPTAEQMAALRQVWLDNEVLYREGLALRVDQGDNAIRERVIFKALNVVESNLRPPVADDNTLRRWFEANRSKYDEPMRFDFQEAVLSDGNSQASVRAFVADLNRGVPGEVKAGLRVFKGRPHDNLVQSYSADFAKQLEDLPVGEWHALATREGWRAMRLDAVTPGKAAVFEPLRNVVMQDWTDATMAAQRTAAVRELAKKYRIRVEGARP